MTEKIKLEPGEQVEHPNAPGVMLKNPRDQTLILSDFTENGFSAEIEPPSPPPPVRGVSAKKPIVGNIQQLPPGTPYKKLLRDDSGQVVGMVNAITAHASKPSRKTPAQRDELHRLGRRTR